MIWLLLIAVVLWGFFLLVGTIALFFGGDYLEDALVDSAIMASIATAVLSMGGGAVFLIAWLVHLSGVVA